MNSVELDLKFIETLPFLGGIGFLEFAPTADRKGFFAAIKKFTAKKLVLLTPDTLFEFLKKKTPPAELKKLTFTQPKDIPQDQLLKLILSRVKAAEEEKRAPQPPRSASAKVKKPGLETSESIDLGNLKADFSLEEKLNFYLVIDVLKTPDDYRAMSEQGTPLDVGFFLTAGPRKEDDPKTLFQELK
jgi:hypothetical protein